MAESGLIFGRVGALGLALTLFAASSVGAQQPMDLELLVRRGDVYLHPRTFEPYSGEVVAMWDEDTVREKGTLLNGRWEGVHEWYHLNGQLSTRETYRNGRLDGPSEAYFKSGQLSVRETYRAGVLDGPYETFWVRGWLAERGAWSDGEPCGEWLSFGRTIRHPPC